MNPILRVNDRFEDRHIGPRSHEISHMLTTVGASSIDESICRKDFIRERIK